MTPDSGLRTPVWWLLPRDSRLETHDLPTQMAHFYWFWPQ